MNNYNTTMPEKPAALKIDTNGNCIAICRTGQLEFIFKLIHEDGLSEREASQPCIDSLVLHLSDVYSLGNLSVDQLRSQFRRDTGKLTDTPGPFSKESEIKAEPDSRSTPAHQDTENSNSLEDRQSSGSIRPTPEDEEKKVDSQTSVSPKSKEPTGQQQEADNKTYASTTVEKIVENIGHGCKLAVDNLDQLEKKIQSHELRGDGPLRQVDNSLRYLFSVAKRISIKFEDFPQENRSI